MRTHWMRTPSSRIRSLRLCGLWLGLFWMAWGESAFALEEITKCDWGEMKNSGQVGVGEVAEVEGVGPVLVVEAKPGQATQMITTVMHFQMTKRFYVVHGRIKYEGVGGTGYLEMWSYLDEKQKFFSRTLSSFGPTKSLTGSSGWRDFCLPASLLEDPSAPFPRALEINLHLPEGGKVWLSDLALSQSDVFELPGLARPWWNDRMAGFVGGIGGASLGVISTIAALLARRPDGLATAMMVYRALIALSGVSLMAGVYGLLMGQPYAVWFPLGLIGAIGVGVLWTRLRQVEEQIAAAELRRVAAMDAV